MTMKNTTLLTPVVAVVFASLSGALGQNLISNGSFEQPAFSTPNTFVYALPTDWIQNADANSLPAIFRGTYPGWPSPEEGSQFLDIGNTAGNSAGVHQTFTVMVAGTYELTWFDNAAIGNPHTYSVSLGGTTVDVAGEVGSSVWTEHELPVTLSGSATLTFSPIPGGVDTLLDNVSVTAIPEPATYAWAGAIGLLGLALGRRYVGH
jgi:hypothetical protein